MKSSSKHYGDNDDLDWLRDLRKKSIADLEYYWGNIMRCIDRSNEAGRPDSLIYVNKMRDRARVVESVLKEKKEGSIIYETRPTNVFDRYSAIAKTAKPQYMTAPQRLFPPLKKRKIGESLACLENDPLPTEEEDLSTDESVSATEGQESQEKPKDSFAEIGGI